MKTGFSTNEREKKMENVMEFLERMVIGPVALASAIKYAVEAAAAERPTEVEYLRDVGRASAFTIRDMAASPRLVEPHFRELLGRADAGEDLGPLTSAEILSCMLESIREVDGGMEFSSPQPSGGERAPDDLALKMMTMLCGDLVSGQEGAQEFLDMRGSREERERALAGVEPHRAAVEELIGKIKANPDHSHPRRVEAQARIVRKAVDDA